jgi:hypothetical protein
MKFDIFRLTRTGRGVLKLATALNRAGIAWYGEMESIWRSYPVRLGDPAHVTLAETSSAHRDDADGSLHVDSALLTPVPEVARRADANVTWQVDVRVEGEQPPARRVLGPGDLLSAAPHAEDLQIRAGTETLTYHSRSALFAFADSTLEMSLARPRLRLPAAADVLRRLADAAGYDIRPSQTGRRQNPGAFSLTLDFEMVGHGDDKPTVEIDLGAIGDGKVILCEAKSSSTPATSDSEEKRDTAKLITACLAQTADVLCLATTQPEWSVASNPGHRPGRMRSGRGQRALARRTGHHPNRAHADRGQRIASDGRRTLAETAG